MDLHHLWLFHKVAQNLSFTKTAEELYISQPNISVQIRKLEETIGLKLIEKYGKTIYLTQYGQLVYSYSQRIFALVGEMEDEIDLLKGKMHGKLNIGASNTPGIYIIPYLLGIFKNRYPDVKNNLHIGNTYEIQSMMTVNQVDFAVIGGVLDLPKAFNVEKLADDTMVLVASPDHPLSNLSIISADMLAGQPFITHEPASNLYNAVENIVTKELHIPMTVSMTLGSVDAIKHAVIANLGISMLPLSAVRQDLHLGLLKTMKVENVKWKYAYNLVYPKDKELTLPAKKMIQIIRDTICDIVEEPFT